MGYILKENVAKEIKEKYRNKYISERLGISDTYTSLILGRKAIIPKVTAYSFTKLINSEYEINDLFEVK